MTIEAMNTGPTNDPTIETTDCVVSIVVPAYNAELYLDACLRSIVSQSYRNLQIIVVDDGSLDDTPEICDSWVNMASRIEVLHRPNKGQTAARNLGFSLAKGEWVWFVDADDLIRSDSVEILVAAAKEHSADITVMNMEPFDETGIVSRESLGLDFFPECSFGDGSYFERSMLEHKIGHYIWSFFFRTSKMRETFPDDEPFRDDLRLLEDTVFAHQYACSINKVSFVSEVLYWYRQTPGSMLQSVNLDAAKTGLEAVRSIRRMEHSPQLQNAKNEMCCSLLLGVDAIAGYGKDAESFHDEVRGEILEIYSKGHQGINGSLRMKCLLVKWHLYAPLRKLCRLLNLGITRRF